MSDPYHGTTLVANFRADRAPNPQCCSDPGVLCQTCAALALNAGLVANSQELVTNPSQLDQEDRLELPAMNYEGAPVFGKDRLTRDSEQQRADAAYTAAEVARRLGLSPCADPDCLDLPEATVTPHGAAAASYGRDDDDVLLPSSAYAR